MDQVEKNWVDNQHQITKKVKNFKQVSQNFVPQHNVWDSCLVILSWQIQHNEYNDKFVFKVFSFWLWDLQFFY